MDTHGPQTGFYGGFRGKRLAGRGGEQWRGNPAMALCSNCGDLSASMPQSPSHQRLPVAGARIILIRHGQPAIALRPRTSHREFHAYMDAYDAAGLDPASPPPRELTDLVGELSHVFTSGKPRADESARLLAPHAELIIDPLFAEAPLASPRIPLLRMTVAKWAVVARILWHLGYNRGIENYPRARPRRRGRRRPDGPGDGRQRRGPGCTWLFQRHDWPAIAPAGLDPHRKSPGAILERRDL